MGPPIPRDRRHGPDGRTWAPLPEVGTPVPGGRVTERDAPGPLRPTPRPHGMSRMRNRRGRRCSGVRHDPGRQGTARPGFTPSAHGGAAAPAHRTAATPSDDRWSRRGERALMTDAARVSTGGTAGDTDIP